MGTWGYVILAYSVVGSVIALYTISLQRRCRAARDELERLRGREES
jgi:CcmD family protein